MNRKNIPFLAILIVFLLIANVACSSSLTNQSSPKTGESEEQISTGNPARGDEIEISDTSAYQDKFGIWCIHGLLTNISDYGVGLAEIELTLPESSQPESYLLIPGGLAPGEVMPFEIRLPQTITNLGDFEINLLRLQRVNIEPVPLEIKQSELNTAANGMVTLTAEIINTSALDVDLITIHSALFQEDGTMITSAACQVCPRSVVAGGMVPVQFLFFGHPSDAVIDHSEIYVSSDQKSGFSDIVVAFNDPVHTYQDPAGWFHIIGEITNNSAEILDLMLIGAFYNQNGTLQGAASGHPTLRSLNPGESCPYEITFLNLGDPITEWQIQVDTGLSRVVDSPSLDLTQISLETTTTDFDWSFSGSVTNDSQNTLNSIRVVVGLKDINSGKLVGLTQELFRGDFEPGTSQEFILSFSPDPAFDFSGLEEVIFARGR